jgi:hypothetical protein
MDALFVGRDLGAARDSFPAHVSCLEESRPNLSPFAARLAGCRTCEVHEWTVVKDDKGIV